MSTNRNHRVTKHGANDNAQVPPDSPPPGGFSGGAAARPARVERVEAIAANDNHPPGGPMQWTIVRHFAEFTLGIAVYQTFKDCHTWFDAFNVIADADDLKRLGIITAITIATSGLAGMVRGIAHGCCLPAALRAARRALGVLVRAVRAWRRPH